MQSGCVGLIYKSNEKRKRLVITFDSLQASNHARDRVSGESVITRAAADHLHFAYGESGWYQTPGIDSVLTAARELCAGYDEVITYGHSMGGYAALLFSGPLDATRVVAFAPQFSVDPKKVPFENRFDVFTPGITFCYDSMASTISQSAEKFVVVDPFEELDARHYRLIKSVTDIYPVLLPFSGHFPANFLLDAGLLSTFVTSLLTGHYDPGAFRRRLRDARRQSSRYYMQSAMALARRRRFRDALDRVNSAYLLAPDSPSVLETYFAVLQSDGLWCGLAHTLIRLIRFERPEWTQYIGPGESMLRELRSRQVNRIPPG